MDNTSATDARMWPPRQDGPFLADTLPAPGPVAHSALAPGVRDRAHGDPAESGIGDGWGEALLHGGIYLYAITCGFSISAAQISLGIAFVGLLTLLHQGRRRIKRSLLEIPFAALALAGLFSLANATDLAKGAAEMKKFLTILIFWLGYWADLKPPQQRRFLALLLAFGTFSSVAGLVKMIYFEEGDLQFRAYGFFSLPITFGECHTLFALTALAWLCADEARATHRMAILLAFHLILIGILVSFTRGAWLGFGVGFLAMLALFPRKLLPILLVIAIACGAAATVSEGLRARFLSFDLESNFFRLRIWQLGYDIFAEKPVFGVGMNNVKPQYKLRVKAMDLARNEVHGHLHNSYMQVLAMTGLFGFTIFCWFLWETWRFLRGLERGLPDPWQASLARAGPAILCAFLATGLTEYSFGDEEVAMLAVFLIGFLASPYSPGESLRQAA